MTRVRIDHCLIAVSDWGRSNAFYRDVLGAEIVDLSGGRAAYQFGDQQVNVHGPDVADGSVRPAVKTEPGSCHVCFVWDGPIEGAVNHLDSHAVAIEEGPVERPGALGDGKSVYFRDPDGNLLELISYD